MTRKKDRDRLVLHQTATKNITPLDKHILLHLRCGAQDYQSGMEWNIAQQSIFYPYRIHGPIHMYKTMGFTLNTFLGFSYTLLEYLIKICMNFYTTLFPVLDAELSTGIYVNSIRCTLTEYSGPFS